MFLFIQYLILNRYYFVFVIIFAKKTLISNNIENFQFKCTQLYMFYANALSYQKQYSYFFKWTYILQITVYKIANG